MSQQTDGMRKTFIAGEDLEPNRRIKISSAATSPKTATYADAADPAVAWTEAFVESGKNFSAKLANGQGTVKASCTGAITGGNPVYAAADGQVASSGSVAEGTALETTTTASDILEVMPHNTDKTTDTLAGSVANTAGVGITGAAASYVTSVEKTGTIIKTTLLIDLTGLNSGGTADDVIGDDGTGVAHLGQITAAKNGTIVAARMTCLETPATGDDDIDIHSATEATGVENTAISALTETKLCNSGDLTAGSVVAVTPPAADQYLYLTGGTGDSEATYTAGILLIELFGESA